MKSVRAGVIGVGRMGEYHLGILTELSGVEVTGIADVNEERVQDMGRKYGVPAFTRFEDLFGKVDVVVVAVPTMLHYPVTKEFLSQDIHVLLEKPCTNSMQEARELFDLAEKRNLTLHIGHVERFNAAVQELDKIVVDPFYVEARRISPYSDRIKDDGVVLDVMIHDIDIVVNLIQSRVVKNNVVGLSVFSDRDDVVNAQLQFENDCLANLVASRVAQNKERTLSVMQKDSYVLLDYTEQEIYVHKQSSSENQMSKGFLRYKQGSFVERIFVHKDNPLKLEIQHFLDCAGNGGERLVAVDNELYSLEIALEILEEYNRNALTAREPAKLKV